MERAAGPKLLALVLLGALVACSGRRTFPASPGPYDRLDEGAREDLTVARGLIEAGQLEGAAARLEALLYDHPRNLPAAKLRQDVEVALRAAALGDEGAARVELEALAVERAEERDDVVSWLLAARLASSAAEARPRLDRAAALDPRCVWVAYARAWWAYGDRDFKEARARVAEAFAIDPGHLETVRLFGRLQAGGGEVDEAMDALRAWIERAARSPRIAAGEIAAAEIDLAALLVTEDRSAEALELLATLDLERLTDAERARAELVRAAAFEGQELERLALRAAERAHELDGTNLLPFVHRAMLLGVTDPAGAEAAWRDLLRVADAERLARKGTEDERGFQPLLLELRARYEVARLEAAQTAGAP